MLWSSDVEDWRSATKSKRPFFMCDILPISDLWTKLHIPNLSNPSIHQVCLEIYMTLTSDSFHPTIILNSSTI